jgi:hypothetical protein
LLDAHAAMRRMVTHYLENDLRKGMPFGSDEVYVLLVSYDLARLSQVRCESRRESACDLWPDPPPADRGSWVWPDIPRPLGVLRSRSGSVEIYVAAGRLGHKAAGLEEPTKEVWSPGINGTASEMAAKVMEEVLVCRFGE